MCQLAANPTLLKDHFALGGDKTDPSLGIYGPGTGTVAVGVREFTMWRTCARGRQKKLGMRRSTDEHAQIRL